MQTFQTILANLNDTQKCADHVVEKILSNEYPRIVFFNGDMGAGKTAFVQAMGRTLGITEPITSPTYSLVEVYETGSPSIPLMEGEVPPSSRGARGERAIPFTHLVHGDLWRGDLESALGSYELQELLGDDKNIVCLEWSERLPEGLLSTYLQIDISLGDNDEREVKVTVIS